MKNIIRIITVGLTLLVPMLASASTWNIDQDHSSVGFKIKHLMISNVKGRFDKYTGVVDLDDNDITQSKVAVTIDPASVNTNAQKRDEHLRGADFFDVEKYPTMTFVSKKWSKADKGALNVTGDLTLHGITRQVDLHVEPFSKESKDPWGNTRRGTSATATINRKDFGLVSGGVMVGEEVNIALEVEMVKAQPKS